ncbi:MAG TPA: DUF5946 family protein [Candidatus Dormibacteraeota bacterium]
MTIDRAKTCPGCGLKSADRGLAPDPAANASGECRALMHEVSYYTLGHGRELFIHQHLVDAYGAQHVRPSGPTIAAAFALAGLYLSVEKGWSGLQVQRMHMLMARRSKQWPRYLPPPGVGPLTVADVHAAEPGPARDQMLIEWCSTVWAAWREDQVRVREMLAPFL